MTTQYCTTADVQDFFKDVTFTANTKTTLTEVSDVINEKSDYFDGRMNSIYQTPITGTQSLRIVKHCVEHLCAAEIWERMRPANLPKDETNWGWSWNKQAEDMIARIIGKVSDLHDIVMLPDAVALAGQAERVAANLVDSGVNNLSSTDSGYDRQFTMGDVY